MSDRKKEAMFARLAEHHARATQEEAAPAPAPAVEPPPPSPAPPEPPPSRRMAAKKPEPARGKRADPAYCQSSFYLPKTLRKAVEKTLIDFDDLDYSDLLTELLRKWLRSKGVAE